MRRVLPAVVMLLMLPLATAEKCTGSTKGENPAPPPPKAATEDKRFTCPNIDFRSPEERCFTLQTFVESRLGPYDVNLSITGGNGAYPPHIPISSGGWSHGVVYNTGAKLHIKMTVTYGGGTPTKDGFCSITDGGDPLTGKFKSIKAQGGAPYQCFVELASTMQ